jgi:AcrR family transcriptional regulator
VDARTRILDAAEQLLDESEDGDIATRAVCEAAGVGAPLLYRHFGDKNGLLAAVVDHGFDRYLAAKRAAPPSADPVADLRNGWDTHIAFAVAHPAVYRLMYSPALATVPNAAQEALGLLRETLRRCAEAGRLRVAPEVAAQAVMAATVGVALSMVSQPRVYDDPDLSVRVRDALHAWILDPDTGGAGPAEGQPAATPAAQLAAVLRRHPSPRLTDVEAALLNQWLTTLSSGALPHRG